MEICRQVVEPVAQTIVPDIVETQIDEMQAGRPFVPGQRLPTPSQAAFVAQPLRQLFAHEFDIGAGIIVNRHRGRRRQYVDQPRRRRYPIESERPFPSGVHHDDHQMPRSLAIFPAAAGVAIGTGSGAVDPLVDAPFGRIIDEAVDHGPQPEVVGHAAVGQMNVGTPLAPGPRFRVAHLGQVTLLVEIALIAGGIVFPVAGREGEPAGPAVAAAVRMIAQGQRRKGTGKRRGGRHGTSDRDPRQIRAERVETGLDEAERHPERDIRGIEDDVRPAGGLQIGKGASLEQGVVVEIHGQFGTPVFRIDETQCMLWPEHGIDEFRLQIAIQHPLREVPEQPVAKQAIVGGRETAARNRGDDIHLVQQAGVPSLPRQGHLPKGFHHAMGKGRCPGTAA